MGSIKVGIVLALLTSLGGISSFFLAKEVLTLRGSIERLEEDLRACNSRPALIQKMCDESNVVVIETIKKEVVIDERVKEVLVDCPPVNNADELVGVLDYVYCQIRGGSDCPESDPSGVGVPSASSRP